MSVRHCPGDYRPQADLLKDRVILVTGAGDGIGRCAALTYARYGATVVLLGKTTEKLEAVYDEIEAHGWPQAAIYPMHLAGAVAHDFQELAATLERELGRLDGILHNAGMLGDRKPVAQYNMETWKEVQQVNVTSAVMMTQACLPLLDAADDASLIFTSSGVGRQGRAYWGAYAVSKFATEGLVQVWADELRETSNIRINSLNPGATNTTMRRSAYPGEAPDTNPDPEALMPLYLYLMGPDSCGISGEQFNAQ